MNIFEAVICHDYSVMRTERQSITYKTNGVHMIGLAWICNVLTVFGIAIISFLLLNRKQDIYDLLFEIHYWELAGRVGILIALAFIHILSFGAYGGKRIFMDIIKHFNSLGVEEKKAVSLKGGRYFYFSLFCFLIVGGTVFYMVKIIY
ncbi:MAG: hypothetical protein EAZ13_08795 [Sphingobacteriia bacterium]|jgi:hypothetical protein|nr:MAG: hypothetical protein EAZ13_08795 [Sphingobacteriia bacterium]